jgi:hypothetical protein
MSLAGKTFLTFEDKKLRNLFHVCTYARRYGLFFGAGSHSNINAGRRMALDSNNLGRSWQDAVLAGLRYSNSICVEELRKTKKIFSQDTGNA